MQRILQLISRTEEVPSYFHRSKVKRIILDPLQKRLKLKLLLEDNYVLEAKNTLDEIQKRKTDLVQKVKLSLEEIKQPKSKKPRFQLGSHAQQVICSFWSALSREDKRGL